MVDVTESGWPEAPSGLAIMGKRQGTKKENKQLWGRTAMAAALWYVAPSPKPYLLFVASDIHGPQKRSDASAVKSLLVDRFCISADYVILRQKTYCTLLETRAIRVLARAYQLKHIFAITHLYHAPRAQRYFSEVLPNASILPTHPEILNELKETFPVNYQRLWGDIEATVADSLPSMFDEVREHMIEFLLNQAHTIDPKGYIERHVARILRPRAYPDTR